MLQLIFEAIILGIVQGIAEFAPISSSAHLIIVPWLFGWDNPALSGLAFDVALHLGTLAAVVVYFRRELWALLKAGLASIFQLRIGNDFDRRLAWFLVLGTIPAVIAGYLLEDVIEALFHAHGVDIPTWAMLTVAALLGGVGLIMWLVEKLARHDRPLSDIRLDDAMAVGGAQTLALFPGVSRSGATLIAGMALGFKRDVAARFSFLLAVPVTAGAGVRSLLSVWEGWQSGALVNSDLVLFLVGIVSAGVSGFFCIHFLLRYLRRSSTMIFVVYRLALAAVVVFIALSRAGLW
jgi:undecaprenyl-diphosphatase